MTTTRFKPEIRDAVQSILDCLDHEDAERGGLFDTPVRVAKMYAEMLNGYEVDIARLFKTFEGPNYDQLVLVRDIPFFSMCEHHMLPFHGLAHVGYIPKGKIVGLSKLARLVEAFSHRLQVQEHLTNQIADAIVSHLSEHVMVVMSAEHLCMSMRGIQKPGATTVTSAVRGDFLEDPAARAEYLALLGGTR